MTPSNPETPRAETPLTAEEEDREEIRRVIREWLGPQRLSLHLSKDIDHMVMGVIAYRAAVAARSSPAPAGLDAAWAEAEAALPGPDWLLEVVRRGAIAGDINPWTGYPVLAPTERYTASAGQAWNGGPSWKRLDPPQYEAEGPTPAAALHALAARLSPPVDRDAPREETA